MTNIDISKLTGDWKIWAQEADYKNSDINTRDDNWINSAFEEDFIKYKAKEAGKTDEEINAIFGADFSQTRTEATTQQTETAEQTNASTFTNSTVAPSKKVKEAMETSAITNLAKAFSESVVMADGEGVSWEDMVSIVAEQADKLAQDNQLVDAGYYKSLIQPMRDVAQALGTKTFNSKEDIDKLYDEVKDSIKSNKKDQFKDFKLNVLKQFVVVAETFQKQKELGDIRQEYDTLRKTMSREDAMKSIKKNSKFDGSYYKDLVHNFEKTVVMTEARNEAWAAMDKQKGNTELTSYRKVRKAAKEELGDNHDKYTRKAFRGELSTADRLKFETSATKAKGRSVGIENKVAVQTAKEYTFEELADTVKNDANVQSLLQGGLITKNDNGTYDIKPLAAKIRDRVGADLVANKQKKDYYPYSEVANLVNQIAADTGAQLSDKEVKKLIKLCGFKIEGKNWVKIALDTVVDTMVPSAGVIAGTLMTKAILPMTIKKGLEDCTLMFDVSKGITINARDLISQLENQGMDIMDWKIDEDTGSLISVKFKKVEEVSTDLELGFGKDKIKPDVNLLNALLKQLGLAYGLSFLKNAFQDNQGELPVAVTQFATKDIDEYKRLIDAGKNLTSAQKDSLKNLADQFVQDGKWNVEAYKAALNEMAGDSSFLNKHELAIGADNLMKNPDKIAQLVSQNTGAEKPDETAKPPQTTSTDGTPATPAAPATPATSVSEPKEKTDVKAEEQFSDKPNEANYHKANKHTWNGLAALYADCRKNNPNVKFIDIVHAIKDINGIKYSDNVIPANLYLPEYLLPENAGKLKMFDSEEAREAYIKQHDKPITRATTIKSNGTKLGTTRTSDGWKATKTWYGSDGKTVVKTKTTSQIYPTEAEARAAAEKLQKDD